MADVAATPRYSGFWRRLGGSIIDGIIVAVIGGILSAILGAIGLKGYPSYAVSFFIIGIIYYVWGWGTGQTVGCMALKMRLVDKNTGAVPGYSKAAIRYIVFYILGLTGILALIGDLWMLWDANKQTWQDKVAGTLVVEA